jgi:hypothetical protein
MSRSRSIKINLGPFGLLTILVFVVFLALKLFGLVGWSWWLVTAPLWGFAALWIGLVLFVFFFVLIVGLLRAFFN